MPYYDYYCSDCGIEWEANVRIADRHSPPKETHPGNCLESGDECKAQLKVVAPELHSGYGINGRRTDQNFKDILRTQKKFYDKADKARAAMGLPVKKNTINVDT